MGTPNLEQRALAPSIPLAKPCMWTTWDGWYTVQNTTSPQGCLCPSAHFSMVMTENHWPDPHQEMCHNLTILTSQRPEVVTEMRMRDEQGSLRCQTGIWKMDPWWKSVPIRIMCSVVWLMVSCEYYLFTFDKYDIFMQYVSQKKIWAKNAQPFLLLYEDFLCGYYCTLVVFSSLFLCPPFLLMSTHPLSDHLPYGPITDVRVSDVLFILDSAYKTSSHIALSQTPFHPLPLCLFYVGPL